MDNAIIIESNEILQANPYYRNTNNIVFDIKTLITNNILKDYRNGIITGTISLYMSDFKKMDILREIPSGELNWHNLGEVIRVGDVLKLTKGKDNNEQYIEGYARITNREIVYNGDIYMRVEFQIIEIKEK